MGAARIAVVLTSCQKVAESALVALWMPVPLRSSIVFRNAVSADRIVVAASRLLGAAAACVILLSCAAGSRKSSWSGCIKAAKVIVSRFSQFWR